MSEHSFACGDKATWLRVARGGYGYVQPIDVEIGEISGHRARVVAPLAAGGFKEVWVHLKNLKPRKKPPA